MSQPSRSKATRLQAEKVRTSVVRTALAALLVVLGIAWIAVYLNAGSSWTAMAGLGRWNFMIGFALLFVGLALGADPGTPLGRGRGVVVGMLTCFLAGLAWIVVYYVTGQDQSVPLIRDLGQYNLLIGVVFMAVGFIYATRWE